MAQCLRLPRETMGILIQIGFLAAAAFRVVNGQKGFVSIDCGMDAGGSITDNITGIVYQPDTQFIDTGINYEIPKSYLTPYSLPQLGTLRSFPDGVRNCYTINQVNQGEKYLIRAFFMYGNYDGQDSASIGSPLQFDLHLGVNYWRTLNITDPFSVYPLEIITVAKDDYFSVCLVKTGSGTPFISSLELRLIDSVDLYTDVNQSNSLVSAFARVNFGGGPGLIRYPNDTYDRIWWPVNLPNSFGINTSETIQINPGDAFQVPSTIMSSAITPINNTSLLFSLADFQSRFVRPICYSYIHFAEFEALPPNKTRLIDVIMNEQILQRNFRPSYLLSTHITLTFELESVTQYDFSLTKAADSILPPILNALEAYTTLSLPDLASDITDVRAMMDLKKLYNIKIWQGDPCAPRNFTWKGIVCTFSASNPPRVTSLNLSSQNLTDNIPDAINNLKAIEYLDLSNNNFVGPIPDFLSGLSSLRMLNLSNNQLDGSIPMDLRQKQENGLLELRTENNPGLCTNGNECVDDRGKKKTLATAVIVVIAVILASLILLVIIVVVVRRQRRRKTPTPPYKDGTSRVLNWRERLRIAVDAALGLEYLHEGCTPPIIHRDVKTSNILLSENLVAKIADFGLSKAFLTDDHTHVSTEIIKGTPGYIDPEYHDTFQLNEKSDVYSFGVVLLELITGLPAVLRNPDRGHIVQWVWQRIARGEITDIVDAGLRGEYDTNSVWKVTDTAMKCTMPTASQRPTMIQVVIQLKESLQLMESLQLVVSHERAQNIYVEALELDQTDLVEIARIDMKTTVSGPIVR